MHHQDAVAQPENLFEFGGDHDDRHALLGQSVQELVDFNLGADIDAAGRLVQDEDLRVRIEPSRKEDLLLVAAAERSDDGVRTRRLDVELRDVILGDRTLPSRIDDPDRRRADRLQRRDRGVEGDRLVQEQTERLAVLGQKRDAVFDGVGRRADVGFLALDQNFAMGRLRVGAEDGGDERGAARAHQAAEPEDFAAIGRERGVSDLVFAGQCGMVHAKIPDLQNSFAALARAFRIHLLHLAADHPRDDLIERDVGDRGCLADRPAVAQHYDAIGDRCDLFHLVRDVAHADAALPQLADHPEQFGDLLVGQCGCRLVEDEDVRPLRQRLGDFDHLLLADRNVFHLVGRLDAGDSQVVEKNSGVAVQLAPIDGADSIGRVAVEKNVFGNGQFGNEVELLMDDGDACIHGLAWALKPLPLPPDENIALIGGIGPDAAEHFHQGRFPGAVLAHQRQHFAGARLEVDVIESPDAREFLDDVLHLQNDFGHVQRPGWFRSFLVW